MTSTPWVILLCKMKDIPDEPHTIDFYEQLFCQQGAGKGGLFDYWQQISYNTLDLTGSKVFGWFQLDHTLEEQKALTLDKQLEKIYPVVKETVDLKGFYGIVAVYNFTDGLGGDYLNATNLGDANKLYGFAGLGSKAITASPSAAAHEMGHGYGLQHSWGVENGIDVEYGDPWDIMSFEAVHTFQGSNFGKSGPGLVAPYLIKKGWLADDRVLSVHLDADLPTEIDLAALGHADVEGPLAIRIDGLTGPGGSPITYVIEYRHQDRWDAGIPYDAVLVHEVRETGLSYLLSDLVACQMLWVGSSTYREIVVKAIDAQKLQATVLICRTPEADLKDDVTTVSKTKTGSGTYHFPGNMFCPAKDYLYTRYAVESQAKYEFSVKFFEPFDPAAVEYIWRLNGSVLKPPKDYVVLEVSSTTAVPPPVGKTDYHHQAIVSFEISGDTIVLKARPEDANFSVTLRVDVNVAGCLRTAAEETVDFRGDVLEFEEPYYKDTLRCLMKMRAFIAKKKKKKPKKGPKIPKGPKKLKKKIAEMVHEIVQSEPKLASELQRSFGHIPGVTFRPGLRPTGLRLKKVRKSSEWHSSAFGS